MASVLLGGTERLIADIFHDTPQGSGTVWVCVRTGKRARGKGWQGCWSSEHEPPGEGAVAEFLSALTKNLANRVSAEPGVSALTDHYFHEGWQTWGPGIPAPLIGLAEAPSPADEPPRRVPAPPFDAEG